LGKRPENIELRDSENINAIWKEDRKNQPRRDKEHCGKGTSRRIMSLKLKNNVAVLNIGVTNHIFDSLKIGLEMKAWLESGLWIRLSLVIINLQASSLFCVV